MAKPQPTIINRVLDRLGYVSKGQKSYSYYPQMSNTQFGGSALYDQKNGAKKPSNVPFMFLRRIAKHDAIIRICINVIKKEVSQSEYEFINKKGGDVVNVGDYEKLESLFDNVNSNGENIRVLLDKLLEDLLVLDAGVVEKVFNAKGDIVELVSIDGSTIRPVFNERGEMDPNRAYVQIIDNEVKAEFKLGEIIYMMQNPQNDIKHYGYGLSPIESVLLVVQASLQADLYNSQTFSKDNVPPGLLDLGDMQTDEARAFIAEWNATVINDTQKLKMVWGKDTAKRYIPFQQNNKDMQFIEYIDWLSRLKLAVYGLSSTDANLTQDVNRATAHVQQKVTQARGIMSVKRLIEEYFNREIIRPMGFKDLEFRFKRANTLEEKQLQANIDKVYLDAGVVAPAYIADREGFDDIEDWLDEDLDYSGQASSAPGKPLPVVVVGNESTPKAGAKPTTKPATGAKKPAGKAKEQTTVESSTKPTTKKYFRPLY